MPVSAAPRALPIFRSPEQAEILTRLYLNSERPWEFSELAGIGARATVDRELRRLLAGGLVTVERVGRTRLFRAPVDSPLFEPLRQLLERSFGAEVQLREGLEGRDDVEAAAIFGSWARGEAGPSSDIDLLVIGTATQERLETDLRPVSKSAGREINFVIFPRNELRRRLDAGSGFLRAVLEGPLIALVSDVRRIAGQADAGVS